MAGVGRRCNGSPSLLTWGIGFENKGVLVLKSMGTEMSTDLQIDCILFYLFLFSIIV